MMFGGVAIYRGERRGRWVILAAVVCMGLGIIVHALPGQDHRQLNHPAER